MRQDWHREHEGFIGITMGKLAGLKEFMDRLAETEEQCSKIGLAPRVREN